MFATFHKDVRTIFATVYKEVLTFATFYESVLVFATIYKGIIKSSATFYSPIQKTKRCVFLLLPLACHTKNRKHDG